MSVPGGVIVIQRPFDNPGFPPEAREEIVAAICREIAEGVLVKDACRLYGITRQTLHNWCNVNRVFFDAYAQARVLQAHAMAEEVIEISDARGGEAVAVDRAAVQVQRDRLSADSRKWLTSKIAPRLYGDKLTDDTTTRRSVIFMPEAGLIEGRARSEVSLRQLAEASSPDAPTEEMEGYEYVDVDETPRELQGDDPDADVPRSGLPTVAFPTKEAEILARRRAKRPIEGVAPAVIPSDTPKPSGKPKRRR